jgi:hypothetical protein
VSWDPMILILVIIGIWFILGFPVSITILRWSGERIGLVGRRVCIIAAPLFGFCFSSLIGIIALRLHLDQGEVLLGLLVLSASLLFIRGRFFSECFASPIERRHWLGTATILILLAITLHSADLAGRKLEDYFPRTNDDTFTYLGLVDNVIVEHTIAPPMHYPSGIIPLYHSVAYLRDACVSVVAGLAELLHLDTHVAFFVVLRSVLPMATLGLFSLCGLLEWPLALCAATAIFFVTGNFVCHQIFQQFLSSASGLVASIATLLLLGLAIRANFQIGPVLLTGLAAGVGALLSPEAHPLLLAGIGAGFGIYLLHESQRRVNVMAAIVLFVLTSVATVILSVPHLYPALWKQETSALTGRPGDRLAAVPPFIGQWLGIRTSVVKPVLTTEWPLQIVLLGLVVVGLIYFFRKRHEQEHTRLFKTVFSKIMGGALIAWTCLFLALFWRGRGYAMLKTTDYFCFTPALCLGAAADGILNMGNHASHKRTTLLALACVSLFAFYAGFAYENKSDFIAHYKTNVEAGPPVSAYRLSAEAPAIVVLPDLSGNATGGSGPLDLFVYCNRWANFQIVFPEEDSVRYRSTASEFVPDHIFRLGANPLPGEAFMDINRSPSQQKLPLHELIENHGYLRLSTPAVWPSPAEWLGAEGHLTDGIMRWLAGDVGHFRVYRSAVPSRPLRVSVRLRPGPDFRPDNRVRIVVNHQIIGEISPSESDSGENHRFELPSFNSVFADGFLQIEGSRLGMHRIAVLNLSVDETDNSYNLGTIVSFGSRGDSGRFKDGGWSGADKEFTWTTGKSAKLQFSIANSEAPLTLKMRLLGFTKAPELPFQPVEVDVNGQKVADWDVGGELTDFVATIPNEIIKDGSELNIELKTPKATTPQSFGGSADTRVLGVSCWELVISKAK